MTTTMSPADLMPERFATKVEVDSAGCWLWTAGASPNGYGKFWDGQQMASAHRYAWQHVHGLVPAGLELDHLCRVRRCVNPEHLEPVTRSVNIERGEGPVLSSQRGRARTHCKHGHALTDENVTQRADHPGRRCRTCARDSARRHVARKAARA